MEMISKLQSSEVVSGGNKKKTHVRTAQRVEVKKASWLGAASPKRKGKGVWLPNRGHSSSSMTSLSYPFWVVSPSYEFFFNVLTFMSLYFNSPPPPPPPTPPSLDLAFFLGTKEMEQHCSWGVSTRVFVLHILSFYPLFFFIFNRKQT